MDGRREGEERTARGGLFRVGYRHCFTVDENLICTVREVAATKEEEKTNKREREKEEEKEEEEEEGRENARMGAALFKRGWGCQIELPPCTTAPRGRLPGRWRSRAASGCQGGRLHRYLCACTRTRARIHIRVRALPSPRRRFQLKSTPGVGPDPACSARPPPLADRFDLSS